jgi:adenylate cyclase
LGREIERKFLVRGDAWRTASERRIRIRQGYLVAEEERSARVRLAEGRATLAIKGATRGASRSEYEYAIPVDDAESLLGQLCLRPVIEKTRHLVEYAGRTWEVDEFHAENDGLLVAELELDSEDEDPALPDWVGAEVTADPRYLNVNLVRAPYREWRD